MTGTPNALLAVFAVVIGLAIAGLVGSGAYQLRSWWRSRGR